MSVNVIASDTSWLGVTFLADFGLIDRGLPEPSRPRPEPSRPLPEASRTLPDASRLLPPASPPTARWAAAGTTEATLAWFGSRLGPRGCEAASLPIDRWVLPISKSELRGKRRWRFIGITRNRIKFGLFWILWPWMIYFRKLNQDLSSWSWSYFLVPNQTQAMTMGMRMRRTTTVTAMMMPTPSSPSSSDDMCTLDLRSSTVEIVWKQN